jgi:hypothetical protein
MNCLLFLDLTWTLPRAYYTIHPRAGGYDFMAILPAPFLLSSTHHRCGAFSLCFGSYLIVAPRVTLFPTFL